MGGVKSRSDKIEICLIQRYLQKKKINSFYYEHESWPVRRQFSNRCLHFAKAR